MPSLQTWVTFLSPAGTFGFDFFLVLTAANMDLTVGGGGGVDVPFLFLCPLSFFPSLWP